MSKSLKKTVSVFIPTYNGEKYIGQCIDAVLSQELPENYLLELLVTDSGSKDKTVSIVKRYGDKIRFDQIPNSEFGHGKTRAKAAAKATGEFILFLTQDATPANNRWLINMIEPFFLSKQVGCVFGRQVPRWDAAPTIKREVENVFNAMGPKDAIVISRHRSLVEGSETNPINTFFSDANSAVRRDLLNGAVPFRNLNYSEDQALARDMQEKGYFKSYASQGAVFHSNEYSASQYYKRKFDEYIGLQESIGIELRANVLKLLLGWIKPTIADYKFIIKDKDYTPKVKVKNLALAPFFNIGNKLGEFHAAKYLHNTNRRKKLSLETSQRERSEK